MAYLINTILGSLIPMCVTAIVTMAITLIFRTSFTTNFAQGVISAFGAYAASWAISKANLPVLIALPLSMLIAMLIAVFVDVGIFRQGRYVNALGKQIITMGLISILTGVVPVIFGIDQYVINSFVQGSLSFDVGENVPVSITKNALVCTAITAIILPIIFILLRYSKWGLSVRATASNEYIAGMMGINTHVVTAVSWGIAGALGALAAYMRGSSGQIVTSYFMTDYQVSAFLAGILGGFSTFHGPVICALLIPLANNLIYYLFNIMGYAEHAGWSMVIVYAIALVLIFIKPQGIFGKKIARKV